MINKLGLIGTALLLVAAALLWNAPPVSAWSAPGDESAIATAAHGTSCSVGFSLPAGYNPTALGAGVPASVGGVCSWGATSTGAITALGQALLTATTSTISLLQVTTTLGANFAIAGTGGSTQNNQIDSFTSEACPGVSQCVKWRITFTKPTSGSPASHTVPAAASIVRLGFTMKAGAPSCTTSCSSYTGPNTSLTGATLHTQAATFNQDTTAPNPPQYYWTQPFLAAAPICGTNGESSLATLDAPRPTVGPYTLIGWPAVLGWDDTVRTVDAGSSVFVNYQDGAENGVIYVKWSDEPDSAYRSMNAGTDQQTLLVKRPANLSDTVTTGLVMKCVPPSPSELDDMFSFAFQGDGSANNYQPFLYEEADALRPCANIRIEGVPTTGLHQGGDDLVIDARALVDLPDGVTIKVTGWTEEPQILEMGSGVEAGDVVTLTVDGVALTDQYYDDLLFACFDSAGWYSIGFGSSWLPSDPDSFSTELFPNSANLADCWKSSGIGAWPSSWVPGLVKMNACLLRGLFIPSDLNTQAVANRIDNADTGDITAPIEVFATGFQGLADMTSSCDYSVELPVPGNPIDFSFSSCTGPLAVGRTLTYTVSTVFTLFFAVQWLRTRSFELLTLSPNVHDGNYGRV